MNFIHEPCTNYLIEVEFEKITFDVIVFNIYDIYILLIVVILY